MAGICGVLNFDRTDNLSDPILSNMVMSMQNSVREETKTIVKNNIGIGTVGYSEDRWISDEGIAVAAIGELYDPPAPIAKKAADLYRLYGESFIENLEGKFSLCLWDKKLEKLIIAVDRFGSSGINYYIDEKRFIFASKIRAITGAGFFSPSADKQAIYNYFVFMFVPTPQTIYEQVKKMPPGHVVTINGSKISMRRYWDIKYDDKSLRMPEDHYCQNIRQEMDAAVRRRFDPSKDENRAGAFLSGGLDSSVIAGLMRHIAGRETKAFSIGFDETGYSEIEYVDIAAKHFGLKSYRHIIRPNELPEAVENLVKEYDEPFGNSSAIAAYFCMKLARDNGVDVLLGGDGGDENFGGYERYVIDKIYSIYQSFPGWLRRGIVEPILSKNMLRSVPFFDKAKNYVDHSNLPRPERFYFYELYPARMRSDIFTEDFIDCIKPDEPVDIINAYYTAPKTRFALNRLTYMDSKISLIDNDLRNKIDRVSQILGVDARFPMLDVKLWELAGRIPASLKIKGFQKKYIYKKAFNDFLPKEIINKKKHGFGLPFAVWLRQDPLVRKYAEERLLDPVVAKRGYFKNGFFEKLFKMHDLESSSYYGDLIWPFLMFEAWYRNWVGK